MAKALLPFIKNFTFGLYMTLRAVWAPTALGVVAAVFDQEGRVLLVKHRYSPGWQLPGGGVGRGEAPEAALLREMGEEVGLAGGLVRLVGLYTRKSGWATNVVALYHVTGAEVNFRPNLEICEIVFASPRQPPADCTPATLRRLKEFEGQIPPSPFW
jgi:8-oxo-dGTP pyrophosphatase MutT (NUDIX family)